MPMRDRITFVRLQLDDRGFDLSRPGVSGTGKGRLLMRQLLADAEAGGFRQMVALIGDAGNTASIALHASAGFRPVGTPQSVGFKHGRWLDVVVMQRPLGSAD